MTPEKRDEVIAETLELAARVADSACDGLVLRHSAEEKALARQIAQNIRSIARNEPSDREKPEPPQGSWTKQWKDSAPPPAASNNSSWSPTLGRIEPPPAASTPLITDHAFQGSTSGDNFCFFEPEDRWCGLRDSAHASAHVLPLGHEFVSMADLDLCVWCPKPQAAHSPDPGRGAGE